MKKYYYKGKEISKRRANLKVLAFCAAIAVGAAIVWIGAIGLYALELLSL